MTIRSRFARVLSPRKSATVSIAGALLLAIFAVQVHSLRAQTAATQPSTPTGDRDRMMQLLHLPTPGPFPALADDPNRPANTRPRTAVAYTDDAGNNYARSPYGSWNNYDETKANPYPIPDVLSLKNGQQVTTADMWWNQRRPEILSDFTTEIYGKIPTDTPKITWEVTITNADAMNGQAIQKSIIGHIDNSKNPSITPSINFTLYLPKNATGPVPLMLIVSAGPARPGGARGPGPAANPTVAAANAGGRGGNPVGGGGTPAPGANPGPTAAPAGNAPTIPAIQQVLALGWAYATINTTAIQADTAAGLSQGIIGLTSSGQARNPDDWGVFCAWSWGISRAMDYFQTDPTIDAKQVGLEGHSRWGKTALLSMALDQRFAIVYASCSGEGGAKLSRRNYGETVDNVADAKESYWMAGNFLKYGGNWGALPVDSHELIALCAPRPVFITGGTGDQWADPHGEFLATVLAGPVYKLLGKNDLGTTQMPAPDVALDSGDLAFREHNGPHNDSYDWPAFLKFAQKYLKAGGGGAK
jgi:hypothetical protein